tara:strand:- start:668 stop:943 length:276 start_codon:yes stop_codon:yes gene_type:complete
MKSSMAKFTEAMLNGLLVSVLCFLPIAWIIRDGLGPSSVESTGYEAILRCFKTFYVGPILILLGVLKLSLNIFLVSKHRAKTDEELKLMNQ